jgi:hypothetical protein
MLLPTKLKSLLPKPLFPEYVALVWLAFRLKRKLARPAMSITMSKTGAMEVTV